MMVKRLGEVKTIIYTNGSSKDKALSSSIRAKNPEVGDLDTIAEEENNNTNSDLKTTQEGFNKGVSINTASVNDKSPFSGRQTISQFGNEKTLNSQTNLQSHKKFGFNNEK